MPIDFMEGEKMREREEEKRQSERETPISCLS